MADFGAEWTTKRLIICLNEDETRQLTFLEQVDEFQDPSNKIQDARIDSTNSSQNQDIDQSEYNHLPLTKWSI